MSLTGIDPICGQVRVRESPTKASLGRIISNGNPGDPFFPANSFFDVFIEVEIANAPGGGSIVLENCLPARMECAKSPPCLRSTASTSSASPTCSSTARARAERAPGRFDRAAQRIRDSSVTNCPNFGPGVGDGLTLIHDSTSGAGGRGKLCTAELHGAVVVERGTPHGDRHRGQRRAASRLAC